jgi:hypothetical protein
LFKKINSGAKPPAMPVVLAELPKCEKPSPGVTVKITKTSAAEVIGSGTALEIFSDPLIRGTEAAVRLKVNNLGSAQMEFLTSENSKETNKVKITLKDEDGNLLSTGYLSQRTGPVVNIVLTLWRGSTPVKTYSLSR